MVPNSRGPRLLGQSRDSAENEFGQTGNLQGMQEHYVTEKVPGHNTSFLGMRAIPNLQMVYANHDGRRRNGSPGRQSLYQAASQRQDRVKSAFLLTCTLCALMPFTKEGEQEQRRTRGRERHDMGMGSTPRLSVDAFLNTYAHMSNSYPFFNAPEREPEDVLDEPAYASPANVFLHSSPACADMWEAARE